MARKYANKLSIYLIKSRYTEDVEILKDYQNLKSEEIDDIGILYFGDSHISVPPWISRFFLARFNNQYTDSEGHEKLKLFSASAKAILSIVVDSRKYILAFGYGRTILKPGVWEERFGLKVVLNAVDPGSLRSINKKNLSANPKLSSEQMAKGTRAIDFGVNIEEDLIQGISGKSRIQELGKTITGKDALTVSVKKDIEDIRQFLRICYAKYESDEYKEEFGWIDHVSEIRDSDLIDSLNTGLMENIKSRQFAKTWMAIPEIISWEDVKEFVIYGSDYSLGDDIQIEGFLQSMTEDELGSLSIDTFNSTMIECIGLSANTAIASWQAFSCLYCELTVDGKTCILSNGKWYEIETDFVNAVSTSYDDLLGKEIDYSMPECGQGEHENDYNDRVASETADIHCLDRKLIYHGGGHSSIEFCDLISNHRLIYVKHYGASSVLSHLFSQGVVAAELFLADRDFRDKLRRILPPAYDFSPEVRPDSSSYEVVYAIISTNPGKLDIPFFSKVNLRNARRRLETFGYKVSFLKIESD